MHYTALKTNVLNNFYLWLFWNFRWFMEPLKQICAFQTLWQLRPKTMGCILFVSTSNGYTQHKTSISLLFQLNVLHASEPLWLSNYLIFIWSFLFNLLRILPLRECLCSFWTVTNHLIFRIYVWVAEQVIAKTEKASIKLVPVYLLSCYLRLCWLSKLALVLPISGKGSMALFCVDICFSPSRFTRDYLSKVL